MNKRFFRYSGSKFKFINVIVPLIEEIKRKTNKDIYVEPFIGSGAILFNLKSEFEKYIINDKDRNIIRIYETFREIEYEYLLDKIKEIINKFGNLKTNNKSEYEIVKRNFYNFRTWFNENFWMTNTIDEGIYLYILANTCINSFFRFGKDGFNAAFGNRFYMMDKMTFTHIQFILKKSEIRNEDYKNLIYDYKNDGIFFLDPPYFFRGSSYDNFTEEDYKEFLSLLSEIDYVYTDTLNVLNQHLENKKFLREMLNTSPLRKEGRNNCDEYLFSSIKIKNKIELDEW